MSEQREYSRKEQVAIIIAWIMMFDETDNDEPPPTLAQAAESWDSLEPREAAMVLGVAEVVLKAWEVLNG